MKDIVLFPYPFDCKCPFFNLTSNIQEKVVSFKKITFFLLFSLLFKRIEERNINRIFTEF